jgi:hypothetical protein
LAELKIIDVAGLALRGQPLDDGLTFTFIAEQIKPVEQRLSAKEIGVGSRVELPPGEYKAIYVARDRSGDGGSKPVPGHSLRPDTEFSNTLCGMLSPGEYSLSLSRLSSDEVKRPLLGFFSQYSTTFYLELVSPGIPSALRFGRWNPEAWG